MVCRESNSAFVFKKEKWNIAQRLQNLPARQEQNVAAVGPLVSPKHRNISTLKAMHVLCNAFGVNE
jgi:hypothetical protein